jgi:protein-disulfide isomerase
MCRLWGLSKIAAVMIMVGMNYMGVAQESTSKIQNDVDALKKGQQEIQKDLQEIKAILEPLMKLQRTPGTNIKDVEFELGNVFIKGSELAKLVIIEFSDYQCTFCSQHTLEVFPQIIKQYIDTGKMRYAIVDAPVASHKNAPKAAEASHCAGDQGKFWEMHSQIMSQQDKITDLPFFATALALDMNQFTNCLKTDKYAEEVRKGMSLAAKLGIAGVPEFVIVQKDTNNTSKVKGISLLHGAMPLSVFQKEIERALEIIKE